MTESEATSLVDAVERDTDETIKAVGGRVRELRQARGMTLSDLADRTGLSGGMLSLLERGQAKPSLMTLASVAHAFDLSLTELIAGRSEPEDHVITRFASQPSIKTADGVMRTVLREDPVREIDVTINLYEPGIANSPGGIEHPGYEFGFLIDGELTVEFGDATYVMQPGDLVAYESRRRHRLVNHSDRTARALWFNLNHR